MTDGAYALIVADVSDPDSAGEAYELLRSVEDGQHLEIESVIVVTRGDDVVIEVQKATDHSTRRGPGGRGGGEVVVGMRRGRRFVIRPECATMGVHRSC